MSILIKGIDMPTKHFIKGFYIDGETGNVLDISRKNIIGHAVEIPTPHGRLIDSDKLCIDIEWHDIEEAPTIIEAEK